MSANYLVRERTGKGFFGHITAPLAEAKNEMPSERALAVQAQLRAARDAQLREGGATGEELEKLRERQKHDKGFVNKVWMGDETEGWKERRIREEQKAFAEGKGYGDLIMEQIREVWPWGEKKRGDADEQTKDGNQ